MKKIVLASNNKHKVKEIKELLSDYEVLNLDDIDFHDEIIEDGKTFEENALIKARVIHNYLKDKNLDYIVMADDSGLCVDSLGGEPGVFSARYAGNHDDVANRNKLLKEIEGKDRTAHFVCDIALYYPDGTYKIFEGVTDGEISKEEKGSKEFGYDCVFFSTELSKTFGQATKEEKNSVSHRGRALKNMLNNM